MSGFTVRVSATPLFGIRVMVVLPREIVKVPAGATVKLCVMLGAGE